MLDAPVFQRSGRYSAFLRHVVERTLQGRSAELKERLIGMAVFHRPADYDTASDPVVRFCAGEVRKRLAQYYRYAEGEQLEIELPIGTYVPCFRVRAASVAGPHAPVETAPHEELPPAATAEIAAEANLPATEAPRRLAFPKPARVLLGIAIVLCLAAILIERTRGGPVVSVWAPFLNHRETVNICTGSPPPELDTADDGQEASIEQHFLRSGHRVSMSTASAIADLSGFLEAHNQPYDLSEATNEGLDNLRGKPLVLVNANNNPWTLLLLKPLRFHFDFPEPAGYIIDAEHPEHRAWVVNFTQPYREQTEDFAIVAKFFDQSIDAPVLVAAGISSNGTKAAGEFMVSQRYIDQLAKSAPPRWQKMNFEAVLKVGVVQGHMGEIQVVAKTFWK